MQQYVCKMHFLSGEKVAQCFAHWSQLTVPGMSGLNKRGQLETAVTQLVGSSIWVSSKAAGRVLACDLFVLRWHCHYAVQTSSEGGVV